MLAVASQDVPTTRQLIDAAWRDSLDSPDAHKEIVIDFDQPQMTCPACLHEFETGPRECPDCGLFLG